MGEASYRALLRTRGVPTTAAAALLARLPDGMLGLAVLLLVEDRTDSYARASLASGALALGHAAAVPAWGRLADRRGQTPVLAGLVPAHLVCGVALLLTASGAAPLPVLLALAAATGATYASSGTFVRARWSALFVGPLRERAYGLEATLDELVFTSGPLLVAVGVTLLGAPVPLAVAVGFGVVGMAVLAARRGTAPPPSPPDPAAGRARSVLRVPGVATAAVVLAAVGVGFGAIEVAFVATGEALGSQPVGLVALAVTSATSGVAGLVAGSRTGSGTAADRFTRRVALLSLASAPLLLAAQSYVALLGLGVLFGASIAPALLSGLSLADAASPAGRRTEALGWSATAIVLGVAAGAAVTGPVVEAAGPTAGLGVVAAGPALAALLALATHGRAQASLAGTAGTSAPQDDQQQEDAWPTTGPDPRATASTSAAPG